MSSLSKAEEIRRILKASGCPLSAAEIRRRMEGAVDAGEVSYRLNYMTRTGLLRHKKGPRQAITGPREIGLYSLAEEEGEK